MSRSVQSVQTGTGRAGRGGAGRRRRTDAAYYAAMLVLAALFAFPLLWVASLSLKTGPEILRSPPSLLPRSPQWGNYGHVLETTPIGRYLLNSLLLVAASVTGALLVSVPAAYGLSRFRRRGRARRAYSRAVLAAQLLSPLIIAVPVYRVFVALGLINSLAALAVAYVAISAPLLTWFLRDYLDTVPVELDEAGRVDGCSRLRALVLLVLPAAKPGIASAAILAGVTTWSQFVLPFILVDSPDLAPVSVGVVNLQSTSGEITTQYLAAGCVLAVAPVVVLFVALQRHIVGALTTGAVKS
ncbi:carbohydrate ABC transporter permease [Streptomyces sp. HNM0575]|uniref:carbohydrate ABC transporter permease n=1 Tax=Streptomyces sp. HNM0575 TaxID=2716338 RepID=UPI00145DE2B1|nr:carbohydrate ABC transporter permease [Streptomyces sp. HNM0575]NLU76622.1 carbohydrate ABC transporter permease [Streptomyces sp. HNM0575]